MIWGERTLSLRRRSRSRRLQGAGEVSEYPTVVEASLHVGMHTGALSVTVQVKFNSSVKPSYIKFTAREKKVDGNEIAHLSYTISCTPTSPVTPTTMCKSGVDVAKVWFP